ILYFISVMLQYLDIQKAIQKELDSIEGQGESLMTAEVQSLTYLKAAWREALRCHPPVPIGIPHVTTEDSVWKGILIVDTLRDGKVGNEQLYRY
ncbi:hypothetical protein CPB86DRAFT_865699, partial [Serendipita vermifera]